MSDDGLTIDQRGLRTSGSRLRTYLPDELVARYEPIHNLKVSAGQADLVLARDRTTREEVVVKLYRNAEQLDREVIERLYGADTAHVVRLLEHGETDGEPWEVQEYCALGTLTDYRLEQGGRLSEPQARAAVKDLADAIHHIHGLNITHRDLKPENILVRSPDPLDLVLTDFGVAAEQIATVQLQTVAASWVWAAPEVHTKGAVSRDIDWWAMGAIVHQLLTGRHPLSGSDGRLPGDLKVIRAGVVDGLYSTEAVGEQRWRNLIDGLLSYEPTQRWAYEQVSAWLNGDDPEVVRTSPLAEQLRAAKNAPPQETRQHMFVWNGAAIRTGLELVQAMRSEWASATDFLDHWPDKPLRDWLLTRPAGKVIAEVMDLEGNGSGRLIRLQARFDPTGPLEFMGKDVNDDTLNDAIAAAERWAPQSIDTRTRNAHEWLGAIRDRHALRSIAAAVESDSARLIRADQLLNDWSQTALDFLSNVRKHASWEQSIQAADAAETRFEELRGFQFAAALSGNIPRDYGEHAVESARRIQGTLDGLAKHKPLPELSPWSDGQGTRDTLLRVARQVERSFDQVESSFDEELGLHIPASVYLDLMDQVGAHDLGQLRAEAERRRREREERERAKREARERAEREAREAIERAEAEKRRLEDATRNTRTRAAQWWDERLAIEEQTMQATENERSAKAIGVLNEEAEKVTADRNQQRRSASSSSGDLDEVALGLSWITGLGILGVIGLHPVWSVGAIVDWSLDNFPSSLLALGVGFVGLKMSGYVLAIGMALLGGVATRGKRRFFDKEYRQAIGSIDNKKSAASPRTIRLVRVPVDKVGTVIGKGGETIRTITKPGVSVDIQGWHEVAPSEPQGYNYARSSSASDPSPVNIRKEEWDGKATSDRPWVRPRKSAPKGNVLSYGYKSRYWKYVDRDFLTEESRQSSYRRSSYQDADDDEWYSDETAYKDTRRFDDFGGWPRSGSESWRGNIYDLWDWFEPPSTLPPAPSPPTKTIRGDELKKWKFAYKEAVEDYKRIRSEYERVFKGPTRGHGGIVVAVVTATTAPAARTAVEAIKSTMRRPAHTGETTMPASAGRSAMTKVAEQPPRIAVGQEFSGSVKNITEFGAFVELTPSVDGLLHISELKPLNGNRRVERVGDVLKTGQIVKVKVAEVKPGNKYSLKLVR